MEIVNKIEWFLYFQVTINKFNMVLTKVVTIPKLNIEVEFVIGKNAKENFDIIDDAEDHHIWFHIHNAPSCHVIAKLDEELNKKDFKYVVKQGAVLCKQHSKFNNQKNVEIVYTIIKNVHKTDVPGSVQLDSQKTVVI